MSEDGGWRSLKKEEIRQNEASFLSFCEGIQDQTSDPLQSTPSSQPPAPTSSNHSPPYLHTIVTISYWLLPSHYLTWFTNHNQECSHPSPWHCLSFLHILLPTWWTIMFVHQYKFSRYPLPSCEVCQELQHPSPTCEYHKWLTKHA